MWLRGLAVIEAHVQCTRAHLDAYCVRINHATMDMDMDMGMSRWAEDRWSELLFASVLHVWDGKLSTGVARRGLQLYAPGGCWVRYRVILRSGRGVERNFRSHF